MSTEATKGRTGAKRGERSGRRRTGSLDSLGEQPGDSMQDLLSAAQQVLADSIKDQDATTHWSDAADELARLTLAVQSAVWNQDPRLGSAERPQLRRTLLQRLETELIRKRKSEEATPDPDYGNMVSAFDRVRHALESDDVENVEDLFSGPVGGELVAEIAHDLRSPLTSILTLAEAIRRGQSGEVNALQRRQLGLIYNAALALSSTASDLIELAHGGDRLAQKEPSPFSLTEMMNSIRDILYPMAEEKEIELQFETAVEDRRTGYPLALSRVLLNLTTNALKFTEEGRVSISARHAGPASVEFSVEDTGRGIEPAALETLYQPFRRSGGGRRFCFSGTGLGLVISRRLITAMGSELQLETEPGRGTRFYFTLALPPANPLD